MAEVFKSVEEEVKEIFGEDLEEIQNILIEVFEKRESAIKKRIEKAWERGYRNGYSQGQEDNG